MLYVNSQLLQMRPSELVGFPRDAASRNDAFMGTKMKQTSWLSFRGLGNK